MKNSVSYREILRNLNLFGANHYTLLGRINKENIDDSHIRNRKDCSDNLKSKKCLNDILVKDSNFSRVHLKQKLIKFNLIPYICQQCGLEKEWNGKTIVLHLDHINGISRDNRLENLRFLCPNCHSQTSTYAGRRNKKEEFCEICGNVKSYSNNKHTKCKKCDGISRRKSERPSKDKLKILLSTTSMISIGKQFGVSDNCIRKWAKIYNLL